ncbi:hypothetical protein D3C71_1838210 [compost metagenome]
MLARAGKIFIQFAITRKPGFDEKVMALRIAGLEVFQRQRHGSLLCTRLPDHHKLDPSLHGLRLYHYPVMVNAKFQIVEIKRLTVAAHRDIGTRKPGA